MRVAALIGAAVLALLASQVSIPTSSSHVLSIARAQDKARNEGLVLAGRIQERRPDLGRPRVSVGSCRRAPKVPNHNVDCFVILRFIDKDCYRTKIRISYLSVDNKRTVARMVTYPAKVRC